MRKTHKDVEFVVNDAKGQERIFRRFDEACGFAASLAASNGTTKNVDVIIHSVPGARWWGGDAAVESYLEDPEASVAQRISIKAHAGGRIS